MTQANPVLVTLVALALPLAGCVDSLRDDLEANSAEVGDALTVDLLANEAPAALAHVGFSLDGVFAHDADTPLPDGYHEVALQTEQADVVTGESANTFTIAQGNVPAGSYDQILLRLSSAQAHGVNAAMDGGHMDHAGDEGHDHGDSMGDHNESSGDGHDHEHGAPAGGDGHGHDGGDGEAHNHGGGSAGASGPMASISITSDPVDIPIEVAFDVTDEGRTRIELVLDAAASTEGGSLAPVFKRVVVERDGQVTQTIEDVTTPTHVGSSGRVVETEPPVARAAVFAPNGDQVYAPDFLAGNGVFVNNLATAFPVGEAVRFSGTDSEAVEPGTAIESHLWDFGDGATADGPTAAHAYEDPGVYEVTLRVIDSLGGEDSQVVRLVTVGWTRELADTSFEDGPDGWADASGITVNGQTLPSPVSWALTGEGFESAAAWQANHHLEGVPEDPGYLPGTGATLRSAEYKIPSTWRIAGVTLAVMGDTATGGVTVDVLDDGGNRTRLATLSGQQDWTIVGGERVLDAFIGKTVHFEIGFGAPEDGQALPEGTGWYVDAFTLAGLPTEDLANAALLDQAGHDGHDHAHG